MYYPIIPGCILLAIGFAGLRLIPRAHRSLRQFAAGLLNLGAILLICSAIGWGLYTWWMLNPPAFIKGMN